jgi:ABC-type uncharacterized transport system permease subunit
MGPALFDRDILVYLSFAHGGGRQLHPVQARGSGLILRATGENAEAAHALGRDVRLIRMARRGLWRWLCAGLAGPISRWCSQRNGPRA